MFFYQAICITIQQSEHLPDPAWNLLTLKTSDIRIRAWISQTSITQAAGTCKKAFEVEYAKYIRKEKLGRHMWWRPDWGHPKETRTQTTPYQKQAPRLFEGARRRGPRWNTWVFNSCAWCRKLLHLRGMGKSDWPTMTSEQYHGWHDEPTASKKKRTLSSTNYLQRLALLLSSPTNPQINPSG